MSYEKVYDTLSEKGYEEACKVGSNTYRKLEARAGRIAQQIYDLQMYQLELDKESESVYALLAKEALTEPESAKLIACAGILSSKAECFDYYFGEEPQVFDDDPIHLAIDSTWARRERSPNDDPSLKSPIFVGAGELPIDDGFEAATSANRQLLDELLKD